MNKAQLYRILKVVMIATLLMLIFEIIFSIGAVKDFFSGLITGSHGFWIYIVIWLIMFLQVIWKDKEYEK